MRRKTIKNMLGPDIPWGMVLGVGVKNAPLNELFILPARRREEILAGLSRSRPLQETHLYLLCAVLAHILDAHGDTALSIRGEEMQEMLDNYGLSIAVDSENGDVTFVVVDRKEDDGDKEDSDTGPQPPEQFGEDAG